MESFNWEILHSAHAQSVGAALLVAIVSTLVLLFIKRKLWAKLEVWASRTGRKWDDALFAALNRPANFLVLILAIQFGLQFAPDPIRQHPSYVTGSKIVLVLLLFWTASRACGAYLLYGTLPIAVADATRRLLLS